MTIDWWHAVLLALVQGITEPLPISSSGHLVLAPRLLGWEDQGLAFDVAIHVGTLIAVLVYFRHDLRPLLTGFFAYLGGRRHHPEGRLAFNLAVATVPVGLVGLLCNDFIEQQLRSPLIVAIQLAVFGMLMWLADRLGAQARTEHSLGVRQALLIGAAQALALVPGTSRSGITMTAGLALGLTREAAARFAFLLAIPGIALAGGYEGFQLLAAQQPSAFSAPEVLLGMTVAGVTTYLCIRLFLQFIARIGFLPFALYRLVLAAFIVLLFY